MTDNEVMEGVRNGDVGRLADLFERHNRPLFHYFVRISGNRELSEDLVQDVFFRMLRYRHTYDARQPFTGWMYQIARNAMVDQARKRKGEAPMPDAEGQPWKEPASQDPAADESFARFQQVGILRRALQQLPDDKRELLVLSRYQNLKYEEIAGLLGCEVGTVKVRVFRAMRALGEIYFRLEKAS